MASRSLANYVRIAVLLPVVLLPPVYLAVHALAPRPWDDHSITATFDGLKLDRTATNLEFHYTLRNRSHTDVHHELGAALVVIAHRPPADPHSALADPVVDFPFDAPSGSIGHLTIHAGIILPADRQLRGLRPAADPSTAEVEEWLRATLSHLDGFTLTDQRNRFVVRLPRGW
jgi:hypothetical protein